MTLCESMSNIQIETAVCRMMLIFKQLNIFYSVIFRKYRSARKKGIFVCYFFTGHQITVMDSERQPEAQNEPRASSKSHTMPPNYCRNQLFSLRRQNAEVLSELRFLQSLKAASFLSRRLCPIDCLCLISHFLPH